MEIIDSEQHRTNPVEVRDGGQDSGLSERGLPVSWSRICLDLWANSGKRDDCSSYLFPGSWHHPFQRGQWAKSVLSKKLRILKPCSIDPKLSNNVINYLH